MAKVSTKTGRNDLCPCGSGQKFKRCCEPKQRGGGTSGRVLMFAIGGAVIAALIAAIASFNSSGSSGGNVRIWSSEHGHYHDANGVQVP